MQPSARPQPRAPARMQSPAQSTRAVADPRSAHEGTKKKSARRQPRKPSPELSALARRALACSAYRVPARLLRSVLRSESSDAKRATAPETQSTRSLHERGEAPPHPFEPHPPLPAKSLPRSSAHSRAKAATPPPPKCSAPIPTPPALPKSRPLQLQNSRRSARATPLRPARHTRRTDPALRERASNQCSPL